MDSIRNTTISQKMQQTPVLEETSLFRVYLKLKDTNWYSSLDITFSMFVQQTSAEQALVTARQNMDIYEIISPYYEMRKDFGTSCGDPPRISPEEASIIQMISQMFDDYRESNRSEDFYLHVGNFTTQTEHPDFERIKDFITQHPDFERIKDYIFSQLKYETIQLNVVQKIETGHSE